MKGSFKKKPGPKTYIKDECIAKLFENSHRQCVITDFQKDEQKKVLDFEDPDEVVDYIIEQIEQSNKGAITGAGEPIKPYKQRY